MCVPTQSENAEADMAMVKWLAGKGNTGPNLRRKNAILLLIVEA